MNDDEVNTISTDPSGLNCTDETGRWSRPGNEVVDDITEQECENIKANTGLDGNQKDNCDDLASMICDIKQGVQAVASERVMTVATNDASKCKDDDDPTLASMWSRILRYSHAIACVLCAYDPYVATILKMGKYPQILMGAAQEGGYPTWVEPDKLPELESKRPVTSEGIQEAIRQALLGVWHEWEEHPTFSYFAQTMSGTNDSQNLNTQTADTPPSEGDTALVASDGSRKNALYTYTGGKWVFTKQLSDDPDDGLVNFAVTNILKGYYATKDVYYFLDGTTGAGTTGGTWNVMDADLTELEKRVTELEKIFQNSVLGQSDGEQYVLTTRPNVAQAKAVACTSGKTTLTFVTG